MSLHRSRNVNCQYRFVYRLPHDPTRIELGSLDPSASVISGQHRLQRELAEKRYIYTIYSRSHGTHGTALSWNPGWMRGRHSLALTTPSRRQPNSKLLLTRFFIASGRFTSIATQLCSRKHRLNFMRIWAISSSGIDRQVLAVL
ncbi:hypothetical protein H4Q26_007694 [Puccinia striiformis f. sp. tritici PST-130]|nr:hypothetical protein H4Q26_007694 [Puccinia striiformis f. sp. tritici PST-130]